MNETKRNETSKQMRIRKAMERLGKRYYELPINGMSRPHRRLLREWFEERMRYLQSEYGPHPRPGQPLPWMRLYHPTE